ncbi:MAG: carboxypeptidase-like regulatory domain-containing protein, partial [Bryobacteraceae bacterium]
MQDIRKLFVLTVLLLAVSVLAFGQTTAAITGQITDPQNAPIANASITARDLDRGTVWPTQSNSDGVYNLPTLP